MQQKGYIIASRATRNMQTTVDVKVLGPMALVPSLPLWLHIGCGTHHYDITYTYLAIANFHEKV